MRTLTAYERDLIAGGTMTGSTNGHGDDPPTPPPTHSTPVEFTGEGPMDAATIALSNAVYAQFFAEYYADDAPVPPQRGGDENSTEFDRYANYGAVPPGFMEGMTWSESQQIALGYHFFDYLTADVDPEFLDATGRFGVNADNMNAIKAGDFQRDFNSYHNGWTINYAWLPGAPTTTDPDDTINVTGGRYRLSFVPSFGEGQRWMDQFGYPAPRSFQTFNTLNWGSPVPMQFQGQDVLARDGSSVLKPADISVGDIYMTGLLHKGDKVYDQIVTLQYLFAQGGFYDFQRQGGGPHSGYDRVLPSGYLFHPEYVDFSTVAIGVYAAGADISLSKILSAQNTYAWARSSFPAGTVMDSVYTNLPARNVFNTQTGYGIGLNYANGVR